MTIPKRISRSVTPCTLLGGSGWVGAVAAMAAEGAIAVVSDDAGAGSTICEGIARGRRSDGPRSHIAADVQASGLPQAAARGTLNALAVEAFNDLLMKHGKRQNVENPQPK